MNQINETKSGQRIAIYIRTATKSQQNSPENSAKEQEAKLRKLVRSRSRRGRLGKIVRCFSDSGCSGLDPDRVGLKGLLAAVTRNEVDVVLIRDAARLSRSGNKLIEIMTTMATHQCRVETPDGHLPLGTVVDFYKGRGHK